MIELFTSKSLMIVFQITPLVFSVVAIFISVRQTKIAKKQHEHNLKLIEPKIECYLIDQKDKVEIGFRNNGLGPALIKAFKFMDLNFNTVNIFQIMDILNTIPRSRESSFTVNHIGDNSTIASSSVISWFRCEVYINAESRDVNFFNECKRNLSSLKIEIDYTDIYGKNLNTFQTGLFFKKH